MSALVERVFSCKVFAASADDWPTSLALVLAEPPPHPGRPRRLAMAAAAAVAIKDLRCSMFVSGRYEFLHDARDVERRASF
jgi:hypothetical protein